LFADTPNPNNDDYMGSWWDNSNKFGGLLGYDGGPLGLELLMPTHNSGGTTEYAFSCAFENFGPAMVGFRFELGFGFGDAFVSASEVVPDLDFDFPLPSSPAPDSTTFAMIDHQQHRIIYSDGSFTGFSGENVVEASIDVPDLPESVMDFYAPEDIPVWFPDGALPFTLRSVAVIVPEPCTLAGVVTMSAAILLAHALRRRRKKSEIDAC
jgi:hypothetical protein